MQLISSNFYYLGASSRNLKRFEAVYPLSSGMSYNSYLLKGSVNILFDTVDYKVGGEFQAKLSEALGLEKLDYLIVQHVEPDHAALINLVMERYETAKIICSAQAQAMLGQFFPTATWLSRITAVKDSEKKQLGEYHFTFFLAPMVHWPEVMVTLETTQHILFSADAFGAFGAIMGPLFLTKDKLESYLVEARRYYVNIVGKYGAQVLNLLNKLKGAEIKCVCPLHGYLLNEETLPFWLDKYQKWASYTPENLNAIAIFYGSIYGGTAMAAEQLMENLTKLKYSDVTIFDVASHHYSELLAEAFRVGKIVLASVTYNNGLFTPMQQFLSVIAEHQLAGRTYALIENGSWAPKAASLMQKMLESLANSKWILPAVTIKSRIKEADRLALKNLAQELVK